MELRVINFWLYDTYVAIGVEVQLSGGGFSPSFGHQPRKEPIHRELPPPFFTLT